MKIVDDGKAQDGNLPGPRMEGGGGSVEKSRRVSVQVSCVPQDRFAGVTGAGGGSYECSSSQLMGNTLSCCAGPFQEIRSSEGVSSTDRGSGTTGSTPIS